MKGRAIAVCYESRQGPSDFLIPTSDFRLATMQLRTSEPRITEFMFFEVTYSELELGSSDFGHICTSHFWLLEIEMHTSDFHSWCASANV